MSGCMLNSWVLMEKPLERAVELGSIVGCESDTTQGLVDCLRKRPAKQIVSAVRNFQVSWPNWNITRRVNCHFEALDVQPILPIRRSRRRMVF